MNHATTDHEVLHYVGYDNDRGGIISAVRALAEAGRFECVLGVNRGYRQFRAPPLATFELPAIEGERISLWTIWRAREVAREVRAWLAAAPSRVFHGHSRAGLIVALWLRSMGEARVVASVHCLGRRRWFYRFAAARLGSRLFWLGPAMKRHYSVGDATWAQCVPDGVAVGGGRERPDPARAAGRMTFGCVGGLVAVKQWELVLHALARGAASDARVVFAGSEDGTPASAAYAAGLRRLAGELGVAARVEWRGEVRDLAAFFSEVNCVVVASRWEASSMAALEAAAAGVPVLAADAAGTRDLVETARIGWLFRADDAGDLARMLAMLAEGEALRRMQITADQLRPFTAPVVAEQWARIYARVLARE